MRCVNGSAWGWQIDREFSNGVIDFKRFYKTVCCEAFRVNLKLEGLSATGSIKVKSGLRMISQLEQQGLLRKGMKIIESSSGNLGLALSMICAAKGYSFTCVSDPNISPQTARIIRAYGAKLIIVRS